MNKFKNRFPKVAKVFIAAAMVVFMASSFVSAPLQAADNGAENQNSRIACNDGLATQAALSHEKVKECVAKAKAMYPGRTVSVNVTSTPTCYSHIRGCTYTVYISLSFPCYNPPFCLAGPDILVATVTVNCLFSVTDLVCHV